MRVEYELETNQNWFINCLLPTFWEYFYFLLPDINIISTTCTIRLPRLFLSFILFKIISSDQPLCLWLCISSSLCPPLRLFIFFVSLTISLTLTLCLFLSVSMSLSVSIFLSLPLSLCLYLFVTTYLSVADSIFLSLCQCLCRLLYLCISPQYCAYLEKSASITPFLSLSLYLCFPVSNFLFLSNFASDRGIETKTEKHR